MSENVIKVKFAERETAFKVVFSDVGKNGADGGYYIPSASGNVLSFAPSKANMPEVPSATLPRGADGEGVPTGGTAGQVLSKKSGTDYDTEWTDPPSVPVQSVNGKTGAVQLSADDVGARPSTWTPSASDVGADTAGTAETKVSTHNTATDAHNDIRLLITGLTNRINALANSEDVDLDQMAELVAYIKANRELIGQITTNKVSVSDIIDNLTTNVSDKPLSAAQGVALKALIDAITVPTKVSELENDAGYLTEPPEEIFIATYGATTGAEILAAYNAGKVVFCKYGYKVLPLTSQEGSDAFLFSSIDAGVTVYTVYVEGSDWEVWYNYKIESQSNKTTSISSSSTNTQYPSAKAVYDALANKADSKVVTGATADADGAVGLVPAPTAGDNEKVLYGDGTWKTPPSATSEEIADAVNDYLTENPPEVGMDGYIPAPSTAEVGQTIVVTAVDENGAPTKWEAVDLPSGEWELIGEVTSDGTGDATGISIPCDLSGYKEVFVCAYNLPAQTTLRVVLRGALAWYSNLGVFGYNALGAGSVDTGAAINTGAMNNIWMITGKALEIGGGIRCYGAAEAKYNAGSAPWRQYGETPSENSFSDVKYISLDCNSSSGVVPEGASLKAWGR